MMKKYTWLLLKILSVLLVLALFVYDLLLVYQYYFVFNFSMQGKEEMVTTTPIDAIVTVPLFSLGVFAEVFSNLASAYIWFLLIVVNIGLLFSLIFTVIIFKEKLKLLVIASLLLLAVLLFLFGF